MEENRPLIEEWIGQWAARAEAARESLVPLYGEVSRPVLDADAERARSRAAFDAVLEECGIGTLEGVGS